MHEDLAALVRKGAEYAYTLGPTFCIRGSAVHSPPPRVQTCTARGRTGGSLRRGLFDPQFPYLYSMHATRGP